jgi:hypothetical protein
MVEMTELEFLQTDEAKKALELICERNRKFYSDPRGIGALKDLQQTFPNTWLYIAELLQNAVDANATRIAVTVHDQHSVLFEHDGECFSEADVEALCARGVSAKGANTVGFMGVGFKSVFRSFESVQISSGPWRFALTVSAKQGDQYGDQQRDWLGAVLPRWDSSAAAPSPGMKCRFALSNRLTDLADSCEDLGRVLGEGETLLALLAWQGIKELNWNGKSCVLRRTESPMSRDTDLCVSLESLNAEANLSRHWILFSRSYQPSKQAICRFLEHRQLSPPPEERQRVYSEAGRQRKVAVFCELDDSGNPVPLNRGSGFALLPTNVTFPVGLHIQADWLMVVTRREMMQLEGNQWHEEILEQLPCLLRNYLEWFVAFQNKSETDWTRGYDVLPGSTSNEGAFDEWFCMDKFVDALRRELEDLAFVPQPPNKSGVLNFLTPKAGRFLPKPLAKEFEDTESHPQVLFGSGIVSARLFGVRARECLERLDLLQELQAADLIGQWDRGIIRDWLAFFPVHDQYKAELRLLEALAALDTESEWRNAALVCIPTASGDFAHRGGVIRYPADWNILAQEHKIRNALEPFVGPPTCVVSWDFDRRLQQTKSSAARYLDSVPPPKFEEVTNAWWESMPLFPSAGDADLVVRLSTWVLEKQPQRRGLVRRVLCSDREGRLKLCPTEETLLAEPYGGHFRRVFFPSRPVIAGLYETQGAGVSRAEWQAFFEKSYPPPNGKFFLTLSNEMMARSELQRYASENYDPPAQRSTFMRTTQTHGFEVRSDRYTVVNSKLPAPLATLLQGPVTPEDFSAITQWLSESLAMLREHASVEVFYIPYASSWVASNHLPKLTEWVGALSQAEWVYSKARNGPFRPCDALPFEDPARPDAPVADLPTELTKCLQHCGIEFGGALPDAPAVDRLRIRGPSAPAELLVELLQAAISESQEDGNKREFLRTVLVQRNLFPMPPGSQCVDGQTRVPYSRVVRSEHGRSLLGNWLISIDSFAEGTASRKALELSDSLLPVPKTATFVQVLDFLDWVWSVKPDAELVRKLLPRAYAYAREDIDTDPALNKRWKASLPNAQVFVQGKRRWVPAGADDLFLDDLSDSALKNVLSPVDLASPSHLGDSLSDQVGVARLLEIKLLSSRFGVTVEPEGKQLVPQHWQAGFNTIQNWLRGRLGDEDEPDSSVKGVPSQNLKLGSWQTLRTVVHDFGARVQTNKVKAAALKDGTVAVSGTPFEFAEELCKVLFTRWGLSLRRDLVEFLPAVAICMTRIDDETFVTGWNSIPSIGTDRSKSSSTEGKSGLTVQPKGVEGASENDQPTSTTEIVLKHEEASADQNMPEETELGELAPGGSYTQDSREARIRAWIEKRAELNRKIRDALTTDVLPVEELERKKGNAGVFPTDDPYRQAALQYEADNQRYADAKSSGQSGHDIDSYTYPREHPDRRLIRRIEVKGRSIPWDSNEIVEMSDIQFKDALEMKVPREEQIDSGFDYWLYVVERRENGELRVLPIRNVAKRTARFGLKGGSWRQEAES